jgi:hypothetical protein
MKAPRRRFRKWTSDPRKCCYCGESFIPTGSRQRACTKAICKQQIFIDWYDKVHGRNPEGFIRRPKNCPYCNELFIPNDILQEVCFKQSCRKQLRDEKKKQWYLENKSAILEKRRQEYQKEKEQRWQKTKLCGCGCGTEIPSLTVHGAVKNYAKGHQKFINGKPQGRIRKPRQLTKEQIRHIYQGRKAQFYSQSKHIPCSCGCGTMISNMCVDGTPKYFAKGHRKLNSEESARRAKILERLSSTKEFQRRRAIGQHMRPSILEQRLIDIIKIHQLPFKYVGNGELVLGKSNPDFVSTDGSMRIIEIFGDYYHTLGGRTEMSKEQARRARFNELGYDCMVLWESDMSKMTDQEILQKITLWMNSMDSA